MQNLLLVSNFDCNCCDGVCDHVSMGTVNSGVSINDIILTDVIRVDNAVCCACFKEYIAGTSVDHPWGNWYCAAVCLIQHLVCQSSLSKQSWCIGKRGVLVCCT